MTHSAVTEYQTFSDNVKVLCRALEALEPIAARLGVASPAGAEWYELLTHKLLPQVDAEPLLVVAIVGGTNIGKSVIFNHLAGEVASAVSPLAAGTKHPVCLVPPGIGRSRASWSRLFEGFELAPWQSADDPLGETPENRLFWRMGRQRAAAAVAARRARRRFRRAGQLAAGPSDPPGGRRAGGRADAAEVQRRGGQAVLPRGGRGRQADRRGLQPVRPGGRPRLLAPVAGDLLPSRPAPARSWSTWSPTTARRPERTAAVLRGGPDGHGEPWARPRRLRDELAALHFDAIKIRTFRGALARVLDDRTGRGGLSGRDPRRRRRVRRRGRRALGRPRWPASPGRRCRPACWSTRSATGGTAAGSDWSRRIHGFYRTWAAA